MAASPVKEGGGALGGAPAILSTVLCDVQEEILKHETVVKTKKSGAILGGKQR
jgi:hypothetical protein